ncbi:MAG: citrate transporter, partial [Bacteroidetes bacterium]|nr:citrate transporter [Bacteroidota bacterium]
VLLLFISVLSAFLDNIAAALIGGTIALVVFNKKVHIGYIVAIVAASNAGGAGSVIGDTTTTMMWIDGVSPLNVLHAFIASVVAILFFGYFASKQQDKFHRIQKDAKKKVKIDFKKLLVVSLLLIGAIISNFLYDMPALGVWIGLLVSMFFTKLPWGEIKGSIKGTIFLLCLVLSASMMPVETLPAASWKTAFSLGFISAIFDNIPLTKLCLEQGHFDWGILAYSVGFGGSMIWFGSSAGVAISNLFPEVRNVGKWIRNGWHVIIAFILGFFTLYLLLGWQPDSNKKHKEPIEKCPAIECQNKKS